MKVKTYKALDREGPLKAYVTLEMTIEGIPCDVNCKYFHNGANRWVNGPQREYEAEGKKKYAQELKPLESHRDAFGKAMLKAVDDYLKAPGVMGEVRAAPARAPLKYEQDEGVPFWAGYLLIKSPSR